MPYTNELLTEFTNCLFSDINLIDICSNINIGRNSTRALEYTFGRARIKANHIHTIKKFIDAVGDMNEKIYSRTEEEVEKIKGRASSFGVTLEDFQEPIEPLSFSPQTV